MPIDDVQYLVDNSVEDSVQFFIDSSDRNYEFYPEPNEYVVQFDEPVHNVFGINILDAAIPSSMFNIEHFNNQFKFLTLHTPWKGDFKGTLYNPNARQVLEDIGAIPRTREYLDTHNPTLIVLKYDQYVKATEQQGYEPQWFKDHLGEVYPLPLRAPAALMIRHHESLEMLTDVEGYRSDPDFTVLTLNEQEYAIRNEEPILEILQDPSSMYVLSGKVPGTRRTYVISWFTVLTLANAKEEIEKFEEGGHGYITIIRCHNYRLPPANYGLQELMTQVPDLMEADGFEIEGQRDLIPENTFKMTFVNQVQFAADMNNSNARSVLGYDLLAQFSERAGKGEFQPVNYGPNKRFFMSKYDEEREVWKMTSPGIVNLTGDSYVKLRCPEIEDFLSSGAGFGKYYTGLVVFKLAGGNMVTHLRFDFVNLKSKKIHPIGKLNRLTFRFERSNGELYDFKGVNHQFLLAINHWVPAQKLKFEGSVLNPEYDANYLRYQLNQYVHPEDEDVRQAYEDASSTSSTERRKERVDDTRYDYSTDGSFEDYAHNLDVM